MNGINNLNLNQLLNPMATQSATINNKIAEKPKQPVVTYNDAYDKKPVTILSNLLAVPTTSISQVFSTTLNTNFRILEIGLLPSANASTNNVQFALQIGNILNIGTTSSPAGIGTILNIDYDQTRPKVTSNTPINLYALASDTGSYIQILINGYVDE